MVVRWTNFAESKLKEILDYYLIATNRKTAEKVIANIRSETNRLAVSPLIASREFLLEEEKEELRSLVIRRRYKAIYYIESDFVYIIDIWDCRRNPVSLKERVTGVFKK